MFISVIQKISIKIEDESPTHLWNVGILHETTRLYIPEGSHLYTRRCENLKSHTEQNRSEVYE
jgi:hypothetical protein